MKTRFLFLVAVLGVAGLAGADDLKPAGKGMLGLPLSKVDGAQVYDLKGKGHTLTSLKGGVKVLVLAFLSNHCPWSMGRCGRLQSLSDRYAAQGVKVVGISANRHEDLKEVEDDTDSEGLHVAEYRDQDQALARALEAKATPHTFIFGPDNKLVFEGAFDDSMEPDEVRHRFAEDALKEVLAGKPVTVGHPKFIIGCSIK
jgi:peroxiredoxin